MVILLGFFNGLIGSQDAVMEVHLVHRAMRRASGQGWQMVLFGEGRIILGILVAGSDAAVLWWRYTN
jgi:hypothetical protein